MVHVVQYHKVVQSSLHHCASHVALELKAKKLQGEDCSPSATSLHLIAYGFLVERRRELVQRRIQMS